MTIPCHRQGRRFQPVSRHRKFPRGPGVPDFDAAVLMAAGQAGAVVGKGEGKGVVLEDLSLHSLRDSSVRLETATKSIYILTIPHRVA